MEVHGPGNVSGYVAESVYAAAKLVAALYLPFSCSGLKAYTAVLPAGSDLIGARGDTILPFSTSDVFQLLVHGGTGVRRDIDSQLDKTFLLAELSHQHRVERNLYKAVFPTSPRDFVIFTGWEATPDGGFRECAAVVSRQPLGGDSYGPSLSQLFIRQVSSDLTRPK